LHICRCFSLTAQPHRFHLNERIMLVKTAVLLLTMSHTKHTLRSSPFSLYLLQHVPEHSRCLAVLAVVVSLCDKAVMPRKTRIETH
jgi:hypothetical protein